MARATHIVGFRHFTYGRWREPGTPVDASTWPNRVLLEESGYIKPLPPDTEVEVAQDLPPAEEPIGLTAGEEISPPAPADAATAAPEAMKPKGDAKKKPAKPSPAKQPKAGGKKAGAAAPKKPRGS